MRGYGLDGPGSTRGRGKTFLYSPKRPERLCGPHSVLLKGNQDLSAEGKAAGA